MCENKTIHFNLFRPENALFKNNKNSRAEIKIIVCSNSSDCNLLKAGVCACRFGLWGGNCPYGKNIVETGPTRRSSKYRRWCSDQEKKYEDVPYLIAPKMMGVVGDYVFLPYPHITNLESLQWSGKFLKREDFTISNIIDIVNYRPRSIFGDEIVSYQAKVPKLFLKHLSEQLPDLFWKVVALDENSNEHFKSFSNIGRSAVLETITPNTGKFKDIHGGLWSWDGARLHSDNSKMAFGLCKFSRVEITPLEKQAVVITTEDQVNVNTIFVD